MTSRSRLWLAGGVAALLYSLFSALSVSLILPFVNLIFGNLTFDFFVVTDKVGALILVAILTWGLFLLKNLSHIWSLTLHMRLRRRLTRELRQSALSRFFSLSRSDFSAVSSGQAFSKLARSAERYADTALQAWNKSLRGGFLVAAFTSILWLIQWKIFLSALVLLPAVSWIAHRSRTRLQTWWAAQDRAEKAWTQHVLHLIRSLRMIHFFHSHAFERARAETYALELDRAVRQHRVREAMYLTWTEMAGVTVGILLLVFLGYYSLHGEFEGGPGGFILFIAAAFSLIDPAKDLIEARRLFRDAIRFKMDALTWPGTWSSSAERRELHESFRDFEIDDVWFRYGSQPWLCEGMTFRIRQGERIVLSGPSGSGKSTLVDLLFGLIQPARGVVRFNGTPVDRIDRSALARKIGVLLQESLIFQDTIRANLQYDRPFDDEALRRALRDVCLESWLSRQPRELDTVLHEERLSGGEKQRIAIARMVLRRPEILILDEATSALDLDTERAILEMVARLFRDRTIIQISHRDSVRAFAQRHLQIRNGQVIEVSRSPVA